MTSDTSLQRLFGQVVSRLCCLFFAGIVKLRWDPIGSFSPGLFGDFLPLSLIVVALLAVTGILNAYFIVGSFQALFGTSYGQLVLVKIALLILMIGFGAWNLLVLKPGLIGLAMVDKQGRLPATKLVESLVRNVICETILAACVILVVGFLGVTPPPTH